MSSTRRADPGAPPRQERFASSPEYERGLMANLVASRCELIGDERGRALIWFLQLLSHEAGLEQVAADLKAGYPNRIATRSMQQFGFAEGQMYDADQVRAVRRELRRSIHDNSFRLRSDEPKIPMRYDVDSIEQMEARHDEDVAQARIEAAKLPDSYPANRFANICAAASGELSKLLSDLCLDPAIKLDTVAPFWFPTLIESLHEYQAAWIARKRGSQATTELGAVMTNTLEYCLETGNMALLTGASTTGKTIAATNFCELHPGRVRFVSVPSGNDDNGFFRAIAKSLGVSINQTSKAQQLRNRVEDVLQKSKLGIVFDSAHFLWPQSYYRDTTAGRIDWVLSALVEKGVPVALVSSPHFMRMMAEIEKKCCWTSESFMGRLDTIRELPETLSEEDLSAIARHALPGACEKSVELLALHARTSPKRLGAIKSAASHAMRIAGKANRSIATLADVQAAVKGITIPSDNAGAAALAATRKQSRARSLPVPAVPARPDCIAAAEQPQPVRETIAPLAPDNFATDTAPETHRFAPDLKVA